MKQHATRNVTSTLDPALLEQVNFGFQTGPKAFEIFFSQLYTNKERAVLRELWSNAFDSHVEAGIADEPFEVALPSRWDPNLVVRDYGVSMDHDTAMHVYTEVFNSTKDESDEYTGSFGLGSKSPFAYTDAFTVRCWLAGECRTYLAAIGADGIPTFTLVSTTTSDEPQGVEVSFPVQDVHFAKFETEARRVAAGFKVKPKINITLDEDEEPILETDDWRLYYGAMTPDAVHQGCVIYPVGTDDLEHDRVYGHHLVLNLPIGQAAVAPNREALSLDERTTTNVAAAFAEAVTEIRACVEWAIASSETLLQAELAWVRYQNFFAPGSPMFWRESALTGKVKFGRWNKRNHGDIRVHGKKGELVNHNGTGGVSWAVENVPHLRFIVDRTGDRTPRRRLRITRALRDSNGLVYVLKDPTSDELARLTRRLELKHHQLLHPSQLDDVEIQKRGARVGDNVDGVYDAYAPRTGWFRGRRYGHLRHPETLNPVFAWIGVERPDSQDCSLSDRDDATVVSRLSAIDWVDKDGALRSLLGLDAVYFLTKGARKRLGATDENSLDAIVERYVEEHGDEILAATTARAAYDSLNANSFLSHDILVDLCKELADDASEVPVVPWLVQRKLVGRREAEVVGEEFAEAIMEACPLLFKGADDEDAIKAYIKSNI